jgi:hypothetical protein
LKFLLKEIGKRRIFTIGRRREKALSCSRNWYHCFEAIVRHY